MGSRKKGGGHSPARRLIADAAEPEKPKPWRIRFVRSVLDTDSHDVGAAAMEIAQRAIEKKLKVDPLQYGDRLHRPLHGLYKLRSSDVRIVYHVEEETREIWILAIGNRRDIWHEQGAILQRKTAAEEELRVESRDDVSLTPDQMRGR
jgi:mRNA-degrading endonuclease RelE of RelBE toxin-antitoxin system